jgi:homopolymeric O-antigen transport system ATP-binding protein
MNSNNIAVKVDKLSKLYRIGIKDELNDSIISSFFNLLRRPVQNFKKYRSLYKFEDALASAGEALDSESIPDVIWALKNVSFEVARGKATGIIGRNGAGKSTLLKLMSRITYPTLGRVEIHGRVSSLLEVGTGFHQELTGKENIYLNGTILGMQKKEIDRKLDEIISFSGIGKFIDTPVKRYSSGMRIRLGFSVAAHIEPEIMVIDEVLAVGDADFQKKCLGKMDAVAHEGRTVVFVSHDMGAITDLCEQVIWIDNGQVRMIGPARDVVGAYLGSGAQVDGSWFAPENGSHPKKEVNIRSLKLIGEDGKLTGSIDYDKQIRLEIAFNIQKPIRNLTITCHVFNARGVLVYETMTSDLVEYKDIAWNSGSFVARCRLDQHLLLPGRYSISMAAFVERVKIFEKVENVLGFEVTNVGYQLNPGRGGVVAPVFSWDVRQSDDSTQAEDELVVSRPPAACCS